MRFLRGLLVFVVFSTLAVSIAACGDDDYGRVLDLGQDFAVVHDLAGADLSATPDLAGQDLAGQDLTSSD